ncbi:hypothetical protein ABT033_31110 [Streptomyces pharetrae]|uniref:hypothetical protein n=1 Tax=Streptomyces pharetrae TaxID=291370 RepID=UPI00334EE08B
MDQLSPEWRPLAGTGTALIGHWPQVCVAHYNDREHDRYGLAVWAEGSVDVRGYTMAAARNTATDQYVGRTDRAWLRPQGRA